MDSQSLYLLLCCLYLLKDETKERITFYFDNHLLDRALHKMVKAGLFTNWFREDFTYDPLHSHSDSLLALVEEAGQRLLMDFDGAVSKIKITVREDTYRRMLSVLDATERDIKIWSEKLEFFLAQEKGLLEKRLGNRVGYSI